MAVQAAADLGQVEGQDLAGVRGGEGDPPLDRSVIGEMREEDRLARQHPLAGAGELAEEALLRIRAVAHLGGELDAVLHVVHGPGLGHDGLARVELDLDNLHLRAENLVVNLVARHVSGSWWKRGGNDSPSADDSP